MNKEAHIAEMNVNENENFSSTVLYPAHTDRFFIADKNRSENRFVCTDFWSD